MDNRAQECLQHQPCSRMVVHSAGGSGGGRERQGSLQPCLGAGKEAVTLLWCSFSWASFSAALQSRPTQSGWCPGASLGSMELQHLSVSSQEGPRSAIVCGQSLNKAREERD